MKLPTRRLVLCAVLAALYCALTIACAPISYGLVQFRISEVFCILPFFAPWTVWGLYVGCMLSNLFTSANVALDVVFGSLATLLAGLCTAYFGRAYRQRGVFSWHNRIFACLMPVLFNGLIVGAIWAATTMSVDPLADTFLLSMLIAGGTVALGEFAVMFVLGLPAMTLLPRTGILKFLG
ncbi:MAG: QueT transporter family protein [Firmicutes bacterium]|nr:QueT transporter family protein [Bacillota bacterium]